MKIRNNGFSLIELIVVIAVMAILTGVLTPQFLKYVEKSKETVRLSDAENFKKCFELAVIEVQAQGAWKIEGEKLFSINEMGKLENKNSYNEALKKALDQIYGTDYSNTYVNVMYDEQGIPYQYHLTYQMAGDEYYYCLTEDPTVLWELTESYGYTKVADTDWYCQKGEPPVEMSFEIP